MLGVEGDEENLGGTMIKYIFYKTFLNNIFKLKITLLIKHSQSSPTQCMS